MRFKPGQKVVCVKEGKWSITGSLKPSYGDIVTVHSYCECDPEGIYLSEYMGESYPCSCRHRHFKDFRFKPLMDITELTEILEQQPEHA